MATRKTAFKKAAKKPVKKAVKKVKKLTKAQLKKMDQITEKEPERDIGIDNKISAGDYGNGNCIDCAEAIQSPLMKLLGGNLYLEDQSTEDKLKRISAIDLRQMCNRQRFAVLAMLDEYGYIATNIGSFIDDLDNLAVFLKADSLRLQHKNKLVIPGLWEDILDVSAIATVHARTHTDIFFDEPRPAYPEETFLGDARYIRVE